MFKAIVEMLPGAVEMLPGAVRVEMLPANAAVLIAKVKTEAQSMV
jgi:hypothetical protein